ncbi:MAG: cobalamin biosynthesis protein CobD [Deltaproteobacteria bacterium]|nr:cobalamin biosynthesis protein CobD [Deltaproteobacteria bacterium]
MRRTISWSPPWPLSRPSMMPDPGFAIFAAYLLDLSIGDPRYSAHPVRMIGRFITHAERIIRSAGAGGRGGGGILVLATAGVSLLGYFGLVRLVTWIHPCVLALFQVFIVYSCLALGDLLDHIRPVIQALEAGELNRAREYLARTVGRDVRVLDEQGVARAAIETLAENFVDGFLSPLFWFFSGWAISSFLDFGRMSWAAGLMLLFKVASTLDSMVGYKDERYLCFGWAGARLDDLMNFIPARISILFLAVGAGVIGMNGIRGLRVALRDRLKHDSPNAAHAESFTAGALGIRLGGPTMYPEGEKKKPWLGEGKEEAGTLHIRQTLRLVRITSLVSILTFLIPYLSFLVAEIP